MNLSEGKNHLHKAHHRSETRNIAPTINAVVGKYVGGGIGTFVGHVPSETSGGSELTGSFDAISNATFCLNVGKREEEERKEETKKIHCFSGYVEGFIYTSPLRKGAQLFFPKSLICRKVCGLSRYSFQKGHITSIFQKYFPSID
jgi:hypothetical protein